MENEDYICESCGSEFSLMYDAESSNKPSYCPFCGSSLEDEEDLDPWEETEKTPYDVEEND